MAEATGQRSRCLSFLVGGGAALDGRGTPSIEGWGDTGERGGTPTGNWRVSQPAGVKILYKGIFMLISAVRK